MRLAVSNIAWSCEAEERALAILRGAGIRSLEIAPTRWWPEWQNATPESAVEQAGKYARSGFSIPSLQAILFGKPAAKLFGTGQELDTLMSHLHLCADIAEGVGAKSLVFGAPKNRARNGISADKAFGMACEFFMSAAGYYEERGVTLCFEPNPPQYDCTFASESTEAARLVRAVDSPGFRLHLDTACMYLADEDIPSAIRRSSDILRHFHVSEPFLGSFDSPVIDHRKVQSALEESGYEGWVTLEMREVKESLGSHLEAAVRFLSQTYGGEN